MDSRFVAFEIVDLELIDQCMYYTYLQYDFECNVTTKFNKIQLSAK